MGPAALPGWPKASRGHACGAFAAVLGISALLEGLRRGFQWFPVEVQTSKVLVQGRRQFGPEPRPSSAKQCVLIAWAEHEAAESEDILFQSTDDFCQSSAVNGDGDLAALAPICMSSA